jgi:hypothetical protein
MAMPGKTPLETVAQAFAEGLFSQQSGKFRKRFGMRLGRLLCGKPPDFRPARNSFGGCAAEAKPLPLLNDKRKARGFPQGRRQSRKIN